jgi:uncharacterized BrkB/YihY/UPF0761 family membrane protein
MNIISKEGLSKFISFDRKDNIRWLKMKGIFVLISLFLVFLLYFSLHTNNVVLLGALILFSILAPIVLMILKLILRAKYIKNKLERRGIK